MPSYGRESNTKREFTSPAWCCEPSVPALGRQKQADQAAPQWCVTLGGSVAFFWSLQASTRMCRYPHKHKLNLNQSNNNNNKNEFTVLNYLGESTVLFSLKMKSGPIERNLVGITRQGRGAWGS